MSTISAEQEKQIRAAAQQQALNELIAQLTQSIVLQAGELAVVRAHLHSGSKKVGKSS